MFLTWGSHVASGYDLYRDSHKSEFVGFIDTEELEEWWWHRIEAPSSTVAVPNNEEEAKQVVEAMIRLEG